MQDEPPRDDDSDDRDVGAEGRSADGLSVDAATAKEFETAVGRLTRWAPVGAPAAAALVVALAGATLGAPGAILALAAGALMGTIAIFWSSLRTLVGATRLEGADAYALGAPGAEEEQKRAVLRALKDIELEHSVGKISDADYSALVGRYRAEAKRLLRLLDDDAEPRRRRVAKLVDARLRAAGLAVAGADTTTDAAERIVDQRTATAASDREGGKSRRKTRQRGDTGGAINRSSTTAQQTCSACETINDADAAFCKRCGARCGPELAESGRAAHAEKP